MKRKKDSITPKDSLFVAAFKHSYEKDGVTIVTAKLQGDYDAILIQYETKKLAEPIRTVTCNGKLTRAERRKIVKASLIAFKSNALKEAKMRHLPKAGKVRCAFFVLQPNKAEVKR